MVTHSEGTDDIQASRKLGWQVVGWPRPSARFRATSPSLRSYFPEQKLTLAQEELSLVEDRLSGIRDRPVSSIWNQNWAMREKWGIAFLHLASLLTRSDYYLTCLSVWKEKQNTMGPSLHFFLVPCPSRREPHGLLFALFADSGSPIMAGLVWSLASAAVTTTT